jgi:hypothetical protein
MTGLGNGTEQMACWVSITIPAPKVWMLEEASGKEESWRNTLLISFHSFLHTKNE